MTMVLTPVLLKTIQTFFVVLQSPVQEFDIRPNGEPDRGGDTRVMGKFKQLVQAHDAA
jgi:hypothetical protein